MTRSAATKSPLSALSAEERAIDAFELLSDETRLAILVALWEEYEPFEAETGLRFSELYARVGTGDSGQFSYHLDRLDGQFVDATDEGYELSEMGLRFVQTVLAGAGIEEPDLGPARVDTTCTLCGGAVEILYEGDYLYILCTDCDGLWTEPGDRSHGHLGKFSLEPAGVSGRSPNEIYTAAWVSTFRKLYSMIEGVCPICSGPVERTLDVCDDHGPDGTCPSCGHRERVVARLRCPVCKEGAQSTAGSIAKYHPAVVGFYHDHGLALQHDIDDFETLVQRLNLGRTAVTVLSDEPPHVAVVIEIDGDRIRVELDETLSVVDIEE
ncbi:DUF7351 domain-containing protein [Halococcus saccharolyticus]|uniref:ArsR family transcriptional regulator n=1 Tax=Halococcus saccharolyticus DSM 5350 TaxID=1227455 RepID=M0MM10_9EURY|nr:helix-turn-helix domain-containing protein [Halococcus saccharolyticus]EMA46701.1 hypothetical protein C449_03506 [Halococcus saccharolyticus DSM 5350]